MTKPPPFYVLMIREHDTLMTDFESGQEAYDRLAEWSDLPEVREALLLARYDGRDGPFYTIGAGTPYLRRSKAGQE